MGSSTTKRTRLMSRWTALKNDRAPYFSHWQTIARLLLPHAGKFFVGDKKGGQQFGGVYDNTATWSHGVLEAGLFAGMSSPARPWFKLTTRDAELAKFQPVAVWLEECAELMRAAFARSNFYRAARHVYGEVAAFGTAAVVPLPDDRDLLHFSTLTAGEYCLSTDWRDKPATLIREFQKPASEVVEEFGEDVCSESTKQLARNNPDAMVTIIHAVYPRRDRDPDYDDGVNKPWASCYFEAGGNSDQVLRESGYDSFPALAPRWKELAGEAYGVSCPGMVALGDVKGLQHKHAGKAVALNKALDPPLQVPVGMKGRDVETLPGGITFVDQLGPHSGIRTLFDVNLPIGEMREDILEDHRRIERAFHVDAFLMLANDQSGKMTAYEVAQRMEEKMTVLGAVLQNLDNDFLRPSVEKMFERMMEVGAFPPIPPDLAGQDIEIEFVGILAQAQKAIGVNSIDRATANLGAIAQMKPEVLDNFDADEWARSYFPSLGVPSKLLVDPNKRDALREARNRAMAAKEQMLAMEQQAATARNLAAAPTGGAQNALTDVMGALTGYNQLPQ